MVEKMVSQSHSRALLTRSVEHTFTVVMYGVGAIRDRLPIRHMAVASRILRESSDFRERMDAVYEPWYNKLLHGSVE